MIMHTMPVSLKNMIVLDEYAKTTKATTLVVNGYNAGKNVYVHGVWGEPMQAIKLISAGGPDLSQLDLCINFAISGSVLSSVVKTAKENNVEWIDFQGISTPSGLQTKAISIKGIMTHPLYNFTDYMKKVGSTMMEFNMDTTLIGNYNLTSDPDFMKIMDLKSAQGGRMYNIGNTPVMILPAMFKLNKGDTMEATVYRTLDLYTRMVLFGIKKKKQRIEVLVKVRVL